MSYVVKGALAVVGAAVGCALLVGLLWSLITSATYAGSHWGGWGVLAVFIGWFFGPLFAFAIYSVIRGR